MNYTQDDIDEKRFKQTRQIVKIANIVRISASPDGPRVTCYGTQPSRVSRHGHKQCGKQISIEYAYRCYYCGFYFCEQCAAAHFGASRAEHVAEFNGFDGTE